MAAFFIAHLVLETITHYNSENDYLTQETQRLVEGKNTKADVGLNCTDASSWTEQLFLYRNNLFIFDRLNQKLLEFG